MSEPRASTSVAIPSIQAVINDMSNNNTGNVSENILKQQNKIDTIIDDEIKRLDSKKQSIDDIIDSKERMIQLNTNFIERKQEYQKMMIALIIGLAICIILYTINNIVPIPSVISSLILIITFAGVFIYCFNVYLVILSRDKMDFDKVNLKPPVIDSKDLGQSADIKTDDLLGYLTAGLCFGSSCCSDTTIWDASMSLCIDKPVSSKETFVPLLKVNSDSFKIINQNASSPQFFSPHEFDNYSIYSKK
jgi:hypothetical protein